MTVGALGVRDALLGEFERPHGATHVVGMDERRRRWIAPRELVVKALSSEAPGVELDRAAHRGADLAARERHVVERGPHV